MGENNGGERVLVTGGAGFIGAALTRRLLAEGCRVVVADVGGFERLADVGGEVERVTADVGDAAAMDALVAQVDRVAHLAAVVGVAEYVTRPDEVLETNVLGTRNVLRACARRGRPVLVASTSEVYGKSGVLLEEAGSSVLGPATTPRWSYAVSKAAGEAWAAALGRRGLDFTLVRYFNVYGPRMDAPGEGRVISRFLGALQAGEPLPLVDGGRAVRAFCYVDDAVEATARLLLGLAPGAAHHRAIVNVGRDEPVTIRDLAERMVALSGHRAGVIERSGEAVFGAGFEEIPRRLPDLRRLEAATGFVARVSLDEGLRRVLDHWGLLAEAASAPPRPTLPAIRPALAPSERLVQRLTDALASGRVSNDGPLATTLEASLTLALGAPDGALVGSGSAALLLAMLALRLGPGAALVPSFTFAASASAVVHAGLRPVFCDVDPRTWTLCPDAVAAALARTPDVRAIVAVNAYGVPPDLARLAALSRSVGAALVYDAAHGLGTEVSGRRFDPAPDLTCYSLHATKVLAAVEGGFVVGADPTRMAEVRRLRGHGKAADPLASGPGLNARMSELHAAVGLESLDRLPEHLASRGVAAGRLRAAASASGRFTVQRLPDDVRTNHQNLAVLWAAPDRAPTEAVVAAFARRGVEARRYFWPPLHRMPAWRAPTGDLSVTDDIAERVLCLPLYSRMRQDEVAAVEAAIAEVARELAP